jgi:hypothetical protein
MLLESHVPEQASRQAWILLPSHEPEQASRQALMLLESHELAQASRQAWILLASHELAQAWVHSAERDAQLAFLDPPQQDCEHLNVVPTSRFFVTEALACFAHGAAGASAP